MDDVSANGTTWYDQELLFPAALITPDENNEPNLYYINEIIARLRERYGYTLVLGQKGKTLFATLQGKKCLLSIGRYADDQNRTVPSALFRVHPVLLRQVEYYICLQRVIGHPRRNFSFPSHVILEGEDELPKTIAIYIRLAMRKREGGHSPRIDYFTFEDPWKQQFDHARIK